MKFGLSFLPDANEEHLTPVEYYQSILKLAMIADRAGMSTIKMTEHYLHPYGGYCPDPITFLSSVASCTKQIRLMTGCILPTFHHPVIIAAKTGMLDAISNGRLDVGFARAYLPHEFDLFQISMDGSRLLYEQNIKAIMTLWTENNVTISTQQYQLVQANSLPKPVQKPHPPIWGAAVMARQSFSWLGEQGFNLLVTPPLSGLTALKQNIDLYLETFSAHHSEGKPSIALSMPLLISEQSTEALRLSDQYLNHYVEVWADATESWSRYSSTDYPGYTGLGAILRGNSPQKMRKNLQAIVGSPNQVLDQLEQVMKLVNVQQIIWQIDFGAQPEEISQRTLELFISQVYPQLPRSVREIHYAA